VLRAEGRLVAPIGAGELAAAYALDLLVGDPRWLPHPVVLIGRLVSGLEGVARRWARSPRALRVAGSLLLLVVVATAWAGAAAVIGLAGAIHPAGAAAAQIFLAFTTLATRDLHLQTRRVREALERGDLEAARSGLALVVGRDTGGLDPEGITRALVETIAENTSDGIVAPLLYLTAGGAPAAMAYKAASTLDSMVGYRDERYRDLGWASARGDDVLNYLPARITGLGLVAAGGLCGGQMARAVRILRRDGRKHPSPNAGIPEAAMAGALGVRLGGPTWYGGRRSDKPFLGEAHRPLEGPVVRLATRMMYATSALVFGACFLARLVFRTG
jgi:adenosylcobinamide-phosphate synthase